MLYLTRITNKSSEGAPLMKGTVTPAGAEAIRIKEGRSSIPPSDLLGAYYVRPSPATKRCWKNILFVKCRLHSKKN